MDRPHTALVIISLEIFRTWIILLHLSKSFLSVGSSVKEKLHLKDIWTDGRTDSPLSDLTGYSFRARYYYIKHCNQVLWGSNENCLTKRAVITYLVIFWQLKGLYSGVPRVIGLVVDLRQDYYAIKHCDQSSWRFDKNW